MSRDPEHTPLRQ